MLREFEWMCVFRGSVSGCVEGLSVGVCWGSECGCVCRVNISGCVEGLSVGMCWESECECVCVVAVLVGVLGKSNFVFVLSISIER